MEDEILNGSVEIDGIVVPTKIKEIVSWNILKVIAGTTGFKGGDTGHGSRTFIQIKSESCTDIGVERIVNRWGEDEGLSIVLGGDSELYTIIKAFEFVVETLKGMEKGRDND